MTLRCTTEKQICHGQKGELRQKYREGQEDQLGALGFMANVCVLWNTVYTARALDEIRAEGKQVMAVDIARLSPLGFDHLNMLGRYNFLVARHWGSWSNQCKNNASGSGLALSSAHVL